MAKIRLSREPGREKIYVLCDQPGGAGRYHDIPQEKIDELLALQKQWVEAQLYLSKIFWGKYDLPEER